jgi:hypothetical protein
MHGASRIIWKTSCVPASLRSLAAIPMRTTLMICAATRRSSWPAGVCRRAVMISPRSRPSRHARAPRRLRVAPGGSAPPIPCVARRGHGGARSGRESRLSDRTGKRVAILRYQPPGKAKLTGQRSSQRMSSPRCRNRAASEETSWTAVTRSDRKLVDKATALGSI